ncbi:hypothetical protein GVAV_001106 [Gurleya vavrai]
MKTSKFALIVIKGTLFLFIVVNTIVIVNHIREIMKNDLVKHNNLNFHKKEVEKSKNNPEIPIQSNSYHNSQNQKFSLEHDSTELEKQTNLIFKGEQGTLKTQNYIENQNKVIKTDNLLKKNELKHMQPEILPFDIIDKEFDSYITIKFYIDDNKVSLTTNLPDSKELKQTLDFFLKLEEHSYQFIKIVNFLQSNVNELITDLTSDQDYFFDLENNIFEQNNNSIDYEDFLKSFNEITRIYNFNNLKTKFSFYLIKNDYVDNLKNSNNEKDISTNNDSNNKFDHNPKYDRCKICGKYLSQKNFNLKKDDINQLLYDFCTCVYPINKFETLIMNEKLQLEVNNKNYENASKVHVTKTNLIDSDKVAEKEKTSKINLPFSNEKIFQVTETDLKQIIHNKILEGNIENNENNLELKNIFDNKDNLGKDEEENKTENGEKTQLVKGENSVKIQPNAEIFKDQSGESLNKNDANPTEKNKCCDKEKNQFDKNNIEEHLNELKTFEQIDNELNINQQSKNLKNICKIYGKHNYKLKKNKKRFFNKIFKCKLWKNMSKYKNHLKHNKKKLSKTTFNTIKKTNNKLHRKNFEKTILDHDKESSNSNRNNDDAFPEGHNKNYLENSGEKTTLNHNKELSVKDQKNIVFDKEKFKNRLESIRKRSSKNFNLNSLDTNANPKKPNLKNIDQNDESIFKKYVEEDMQAASISNNFSFKLKNLATSEKRVLLLNDFIKEIFKMLKNNFDAGIQAYSQELDKNKFLCITWYIQNIKQIEFTENLYNFINKEYFNDIQDEPYKLIQIEFKDEINKTVEFNIYNNLIEYFPIAFYINQKEDTKSVEMIFKNYEGEENFKHHLIKIEKQISNDLYKLNHQVLTNEYKFKINITNSTDKITAMTRKNSIINKINLWDENKKDDVSNNEDSLFSDDNYESDDFNLDSNHDDQQPINFSTDDELINDNSEFYNEPHQSENNVISEHNTDDSFEEEFAVEHEKIIKIEKKIDYLEKFIKKADCEANKIENINKKFSEIEDRLQNVNKMMEKQKNRDFIVNPESYDFLGQYKDFCANLEEVQKEIINPIKEKDVNEKTKDENTSHLNENLDSSKEKDVNEKTKDESTTNLNENLDSSKEKDVNEKIKDESTTNLNENLDLFKNRAAIDKTKDESITNYDEILDSLKNRAANEKIKEEDTLNFKENLESSTSQIDLKNNEENNFNDIVSELTKLLLDNENTNKGIDNNEKIENLIIKLENHAVTQINLGKKRLTDYRNCLKNHHDINQSEDCSLEKKKII